MTFKTMAAAAVGLVCLLAVVEAVPAISEDAVARQLEARTTPEITGTETVAELVTLCNARSRPFLRLYEAGSPTGRFAGAIRDGDVICPTTFPGGFTILCSRIPSVRLGPSLAHPHVF